MQKRHALAVANRPASNWAEQAVTGPVSPVLTVSDWLAVRWSALRPLRVYPDMAEPRRISLVTDTISPSSLFGGVGTALILAALWAKRSGAQLRIVTRTEQPATTSFSSVLAANGIAFDEQVEFLHAPHFNSTEMALGSRDLFLATSWWTARSLLGTVPADRIVYLLQEDERMFYPYGDDHLACSTTMAEPFALVAINSGILHRHLTEGTHAVAGLSARAIGFEPAFTYPRRTAAPRAAGTRRKLFFYARPNNPRNLYATGLGLISEAVLQGVLDPARWEVHLVGKGLEELVFDGGLIATCHQPMPWREYGEFLRGMDAGLSLMYTPHPSYPPIDMAAMGIPVLTNRFGPKTDLSAYSNNILMAELTTPALLDGLRRLFALADDHAACAANADGDRINRDWETALGEVVGRLDGLAGKFA